MLFDHPDVIDAAVVGVPHKTLGEEVKAVVQLRAGLDGDAPTTSARSAASTSPTSRCRSTSRSATSRCRAIPAGKVLKNVLRGRRDRRSRPPTTRRCSRTRSCCSTSTASGATPRSSPTSSRARTRSRAWRWPRLRGRWLWWPTIVAEAMMMIQVLARRAARERRRTSSRRASTCSTASSRSSPSGLLYSYRYVWRARGWMELAYGLGGLFIMGLGIRAVLQVDEPDDGRARAPATRPVAVRRAVGRARRVARRPRSRSRARSIPTKYEVVPVGDHDRRSLAARRRGAARMLEGGTRRAARPRSRSRATGRAAVGPGARRARAAGVGAPLGVDVVLPLLHGPYGEDGTVQGLLELAGLPYVGAGVLGSAVGMDKIVMKRAFAAAGLPHRARTSRCATATTSTRSPIAVEAELGLPCFVKPSNMGSSVGVSQGARRARAATPRSRSRSSSTSGSSPRRWSPAARSRSACSATTRPRRRCRARSCPAADFYDYADKYEDGKAELLVPAPLDRRGDRRRCARSRCGRSRRAGARRWRASTSSCATTARSSSTSSTRSRASRRSRCTRGSGKLSGVPYAELLDRLIDLAIARHARRAAARPAAQR